MTAPDFLTWEGDDDNVPRRPSTDDLGGDHFEDDSEFPPDPQEFPGAAAFNQLVQQVAAMARTQAAAKLEVRFSGGAPYIARASGPSSAIVPALFTVTDMGTGDTKVEWPADTFPTPQCSPTGLTLIHNAAAETAIHLEEITNGIRVKTRSGGAAADLAWTVEIN